ncbi:MAG TPA: glycosyltransferase family 1 protein [Candidatus Angelobacter sp.]|nr:glycosyltransferase family 1 protein [Candidatus Angelobacter sp.]
MAEVAANVAQAGKAKIRVGFDARWYNDSGVGVYVAQLLKAMVPEQRDFELVVYEGEGNPVSGLEEAEATGNNGAPMERIILRSGKYSLRSQFELRRRCRQDGIDVFHSPFYPIPLAVDCPVVVTLHDLIPFLFPLDAWPKQFFVRAGYRVAAARGAHIITVSRHTSADVQKILRVPPEKITAIHNAASPEEFHAIPAAGETEWLEAQGIRRPYVVVISARNWPTKNLGGALRALSAAFRRAPLSPQIVVCGPHDGLTAAGGTNAWPDLKLYPIGYVSPRELAVLFRHGSLFLMPSLYEGFGLPILEAMSCGCPVIASNTGSLAEVAGNGAQTFALEDVEGMAEAIQLLLQDIGVFKQWRERGLRRASSFSWRDAALQTISVYHQTYGAARP